MFRDSFLEFHHTLQSLHDIPGALRLQQHDTRDHSYEDSQTETAHRRALRRMDRFLTSLPDLPLDEIEVDHAEEEDNDMIIDTTAVEPMTEGKSNAEGLHEERTDISLNSIMEALQQDLVIIVQALDSVPDDDDDTKRDLAESCIGAAAQAIIAFDFVLSSNDLVAILNRLLLTGLDDDHQNIICGYLLWILNTQFENGAEIRSNSIAVLASGEILEMMAQEISGDCLAEDIDSSKRSWCTLTAFLVQFSLPEKGTLNDLDDLKQWLVEQLAQADINGDSGEEMALKWMANASQYALSIADIALDALDMNHGYAIYYATLTTKTLVCLGALFAEELQPTVTRLWTTMVSSFLDDDAHLIDTSLQHSVSSLTFELFEVVSTPKQSTTVLMFFRALEFPELILSRNHIVELIPHESLQWAVLTMLNQERVEMELVDRILEILAPTMKAGDLMNKFFWRKVNDYVDVEAM